MTQQPLDLAISGGTVVDGTGASAFAADVGIAGGRIVAVGALAQPARRVIDARGLVVAPGFIDVHAHDDMALIRGPRLDFKVMQGVTTEVVGNCGSGVAPVSPDYRQHYEVFLSSVLGPAADFSWNTTAEFYAALEKAGPSLNVAAFAPHGTLRFAVMGMEPRPPSTAEMEQMKELLEEALAAGAIGLSSGLIYPPGAFATTDELIELCRVVAGHGGMYASHIRNEGDHLLEAVDEAISIGREAGVPVQISHHKASGRGNWGKVVDSLALIDRARAEGLDVTVDVYPYTAGSTLLTVILAGGVEEGGPEDVLVAAAPRRPELEGKSLQQIGELMALPPLEAGQKLVQEDPSVVAIGFGMAEEDVRRVMAHPAAMFGSDGIPSAGGKPHPRLYGTFPRVLGTYVRRENVLGLEEAVHKMTDLPARKHRLAERGRLAPGYHADVTVFDPRLINDLATYQDPRRYPDGIRYVIVNGEVVVEAGRHTGKSAGCVLRAGG
jgi:N-acyl-D-aspartate/D-glutamate deacylase